MDIASPPSQARTADLVRAGALDAELGAMLEVLVDEGLSLVVAAAGDGPAAGGGTATARRTLAAIDAGRVPVDLDALGDGIPALLRAASLGAGFAATIEADSLEAVFERLRSAGGVADDELSYLGLVVVLDADGRVTAAHYVRPIALDAQGHVQRLGPAVLAARDATSGRLESFAWGVMPELASRIRRRTGDLELDLGRRADALARAAGHRS